MGYRCNVLLRCRYDVPIRCCGDVPLRRLDDVPPRRRWVFYLRRTCDVAGTYRETSLRRLVAELVSLYESIGQLATKILKEHGDTLKQPLSYPVNLSFVQGFVSRIH